MRFRSEQHLRRPSEIRAVRERGRRGDCGAFTFWWTLPAPSAAPPAGARVCVIASTAAVGGAVSRNRAKRRLRELYRRGQAAVPAGCHLLLIARVGILRWDFAELEKRFNKACAQLVPTSHAP